MQSGESLRAMTGHTSLVFAVGLKEGRWISSVKALIFAQWSTS
jgi:hypothetical protein